jgi:hypothetical protein
MLAWIAAINFTRIYASQVEGIRRFTRYERRDSVL